MLREALVGALCRKILVSMGLAYCLSERAAFPCSLGCNCIASNFSSAVWVRVNVGGW